MSDISFNPSLMTAAQNTFLLQTQGWVQGLTQDDPVSRMHLLSGIVAAAVTQPIWGGLGVTVENAGVSNDNRQGQSVSPASTTEIQGFTVFDQAINMIQVPGNTVPVSVAGQSVAIYLFGSKARVPVPLDSGALSALESAVTNVTLYWDTVNFALTNASGTNTIELPSTVQLLALNAANSKIVSYNSTTGAVSWLENQPAALIQL